MALEEGALVIKNQLATEDLALKIFHSEPVAEARTRARALMMAVERAKTASAQKTLDRALNELSFLACSVTVLDETRPPKIHWTINLPHHWFGRKVYGMRSGIDNPDNMYRFISIDDQSSYVISGRRLSSPPCDMTMNIYGVYPGDINDPHGVYPPTMGMVSLNDLSVGGPQDFEVTVDPLPANGRVNHLQSKPGAKMILVRDTLSDWSREMPTRLSITRLAGPPVRHDASEPELMRIAAEKVDRAVRFWLQCTLHYYLQSTANQLCAAHNPAFGKGGQFPLTGNYKLADDEAYVCTLDPLGSTYLGFQLADLFGAGLDYAHHTCSLNGSQAQPNADGTITYVLSVEDPGVHNWIDPMGLNEGVMMVRYQGYDPNKVDSLDRMLPSQMVVKLSDLKGVLPRETRWITRDERRAQLDIRLATYHRRVGKVEIETPHSTFNR